MSSAGSNTVVALVREVGTDLVTRSQAKRVMSRCSSFDQVTLDFAGIASVTPSFVDEVFRVFQGAHPGIELRWVNAPAEVEGRITHSRSNAT
jgi:STAS-like domain of unknown function (DUF4325)